MTDECFSTLSSHARKLDAGIKKLTETWRNPSLILGGYGADEKISEANLEIVQHEITELKKEIDDSSISTANHVAEMDKFLQESQKICDNLVSSCQDIGTVLSEYGYVKPEDVKSEIKLETECSVDSSLISSDVTDDLLEVEFTPNMTWRHKSKVNDLEGK